ncbi:MAG: penicillin-binding protein activator [Rhodospirillales bacterium]|nr:penicillin-binding protein activator [Rhodospirillales bacterium]
MIAGPSSTQSGTSNLPKTQQLPPVSGPRVPPGPILTPVPQTAPSARAGEPLPSLAELLNRPATAGAQPDVMTSTVPMAGEGTVRVALLVPLSGPAAKLGQGMLNAAQMALFQFSNDRFELLPHDTKGTVDGALAAAQLAIGDGAQLILGPLLSQSVQAVGPIARAANVPVIGFSNDRTVAGNGIYVMGFLPSAQTDRVLSYAIGRGLTRFGLLAPDNAFGAAVLQTMQEVTLRSGAQITRARLYNPNADDYTDVVREISDFDARKQELKRQISELKKLDDAVSKKTLERLEQLQTAGDLPFNVLLVADGGKRLQQIAALLPFFDVDPAVVKVLGIGQWDVPGLGNEPALVGAWYAAPDPAARTDFVKEYAATFGEQPPRLATLAYDAMALAAVLGQGETGPDFSTASLASPNGYWGRDGIFRLTSSGITERGLAVLEVTRKGSKIVDPAPVSFQARIN